MRQFKGRLNISPFTDPPFLQKHPHSGTQHLNGSGGLLTATPKNGLSPVRLTCHQTPCCSLEGMRKGKMAQQRVDWVDAAKGICIVFVVMMHSTLGVETGANMSISKLSISFISTPFGSRSNSCSRRLAWRRNTALAGLRCFI